jgi:hypothetical protein
MVHHQAHRLLATEEAVIPAPACSLPLLHTVHPAGHKERHHLQDPGQGHQVEDRLEDRLEDHLEDRL